MNTNSIAFIDFETTGLDPKKNYPTEVAIRKINYDSETNFVTKEDYNELIQLPEGVEINEFIQNLTGLTTEKVNTEGKHMDKVAQKVRELIDDKTIVVAHSANFDLGYLAVHFGVIPSFFYDTKTVEFFANPTASTKLSDCHQRYAPEKTFTQTHRAMDDVHMLMDVFHAQAELHGEHMTFFLNKIAILPERPLVHYPEHGIFLDYSQKYASKREVEYLEERSETLARLEAYGVDNWSGYCDALSDSGGVLE